MFKKIILVLLGLFVIAGGTLFALNGKDNYDASKYGAKVSNGLNIGSKIEFTLPDQFDKSHTLTDNTKILVLSFAKATGHTIKTFLNAQPKNYLPSRDAMFVADISPMPTIIRNAFALPDLRESPFSVLLIYDEDIAKQIKDEDKKDKIIIVKLQNKVIKSIDYIDTAKELESALN